jgi:hypothetical protein
LLVLLKITCHAGDAILRKFKSPTCTKIAIDLSLHMGASRWVSENRARAAVMLEFSFLTGDTFHENQANT